MFNLFGKKKKRAEIIEQLKATAGCLDIFTDDMKFTSDSERRDVDYRMVKSYIKDIQKYIKELREI